MARSVTVTTALETTALGFGCAGLFREASSSKRLHLLESAFDRGIRHFDAAPMYGLGIAEGELGRFARHRRDSVVIATKFGIDPTPFARALARVQGPIRRLLAAARPLRQAAMSTAAGPSSGPAGALLYTSRGYGAAAARSSLERSLKEFGTDYIDLLLLHDPTPENMQSSDIYAFLEDARKSGLIRAWGIAGEPVPAVRVAQAFPHRVPVLQVRDDLFDRVRQTVRADAADGMVTFGILGRALPQLLAYATAEPRRVARWNAVLDADCSDPATLASLLLRDAFRANPDGVVLFSTVHVENVDTAAAAADMDPRGLDDLLDRFREVVVPEAIEPDAGERVR